MRTLPIVLLLSFLALAPARCARADHEFTENFEGDGSDLADAVDINQEIDLSNDAEFTREKFEALMGKRRHQARVFLMDQSALSAIGNAYAGEILFAARIHPKTPCFSLSPEERLALYQSIRSVMAWGISEVEKAGQPIEVKVRDHVKVRNRNNQPCPVCGTKIRRAGVLGYDSFFCPRCQAASRPQRIPW